MRRFPRPSSESESGKSKWGLSNGGLRPLSLRACRPSKEVPKPRPGKVPKRVLRKVPAENGVPRKVPKKCFGVRSSVETSTGERTPKHFFGTFLGTPFSAGTFRSTLFGTFPGRGFGTSLDGRQARKASSQATSCCKTPMNSIRGRRRAGKGWDRGGDVHGGSRVWILSIEFGHISS